MSSNDLNQHDDAGAEPDFPYSLERLLQPAETASPNLLWFGNDMHDGACSTSGLTYVCATQ